MTAAEAKERLLHSKMPNDAERREYDFVVFHALDKQIPKKPTNFSIDNNGYTIYDCECPNCEQSHRELFPFAFCIHCGQALEWEGTDNAQT